MTRGVDTPGTFRAPRNLTYAPSGMPLLRVLVTGSRTWRSARAVGVALDVLFRENNDRGLMVVHGACPLGADRFAHEWAVRTNGAGGMVAEDPYPAEWDRYGEAAGQIRNAQMVGSGIAVCLAFLDPCVRPRCGRAGDHPSHGAGWTADAVAQLGVPTHIHLSRYGPAKPGHLGHAHRPETPDVPASALGEPAGAASLANPGRVTYSDGEAS